MSFITTSNVGNGAEVEWIIPDMILQNEFNLVDGRGESGKSSIVTFIIGQWHNLKKLKNERQLRRVLWLSQEEEFDAITKPRLLQYGLEPDQVITIDYASGACRRPIMPMDHDALSELIKAKNVNCIVIDPFSELKQVDWNINDGDAMRNYISSLSRMCKQTRSTMFGMRHMRKAAGVYSSDDGTGSAQIRDTSRCVIRVDRTEGKQRRYFWSVQKCNSAKTTKPMEFAFEETPFAYGRVKAIGHQDISIEEIKKMSESRVKRSKLEDAKILLLQALHDGDKSCNELIEEANENGIGDRTLDDAKADLEVTSHRIVPQQGKAYFVWRLPEKLRSKDYITIKGKDMPQLTITDLPEYTNVPLKTLPVDFQTTDTETETPQGTEEIGNPVEGTAGKKVPSARGAKQRQPKVKPQPKPEGKGGNMKTPRKPKSK